MLKYLHRYRRTLRFFVGVAALVLCSGQVLAGQHLHGANVPDEICSLCGFSDSTAAPAAVGIALPEQLRSNADAPRADSRHLAHRPFENSLTRAPPAS